MAGLLAAINAFGIATSKKSPEKQNRNAKRTFGDEQITRRRSVLAYTSFTVLPGAKKRGKALSEVLLGSFNLRILSMQVTFH